MNAKEAINALKTGRLVIIPTETVYGLAASLAYPEAIAQIFAIKKRPLSKPLIVHIADIDQLYPLITELPPGAEQLIETHWPGPLSLVLPAQLDAVPPIARADGPTVAVRMPDNPIALEIIRATGPLVATSVNLSGEDPATDPAHIPFPIPIVESTTPLSGSPSTLLHYHQEKWITLRSGSLERDTSPHLQRG